MHWKHSFLCVVLSAAPASAAEFRLEKIYVLEGGEARALGKLEAIDQLVERRDAHGALKPLRLYNHIDPGDTLTARTGANVLLSSGEDGELWLNYETTWHLTPDGTSKPISGRVMNIDSDAGTRSAGRFYDAFPDGTEYYVNAQPDAEIVYVLEGAVTCTHRSGETIVIEEGQAAEASEEGLRLVELFAPDVASIRKWRETIGFARMSWLTKLLTFPVRNPVPSLIVAGAAGAWGAYEIGRDRGQEDAEVVIRVNPPR